MQWFVKSIKLTTLMLEKLASSPYGVLLTLTQPNLIYNNIYKKKFSKSTFAVEMQYEENQKRDL